MMHSISITLLGIALILQEIQIVGLKRKINFIDRQRKRIWKSLEIQSGINHHVCVLLGCVLSSEDSEVK